MMKCSSPPFGTVFILLSFIGLGCPSASSAMTPRTCTIFPGTDDNFVVGEGTLWQDDTANIYLTVKATGYSAKSVPSSEVEKPSLSSSTVYTENDQTWLLAKARISLTRMFALSVSSCSLFGNNKAKSFYQEPYVVTIDIGISTTEEEATALVGLTLHTSSDSSSILGICDFDESGEAVLSVLQGSCSSVKYIWGLLAVMFLLVIAVTAISITIIKDKRKQKREAKRISAGRPDEVDEESGGTEKESTSPSSPTMMSSTNGILKRKVTDAFSPAPQSEAPTLPTRHTTARQHSSQPAAGVIPPESVALSRSTSAANQSTRADTTQLDQYSTVTSPGKRSPNNITLPH